jgi:hypothetical protein
MYDIDDWILTHKGLTNDQRTFTRAYAAALLWSSTVMIGEDVDNDSEYADEYSEQCSKELCEHILTDCLNFMREYSALIYTAAMLPDYDMSQAGHDFALTRNSHGVGYWHRGLGDIGDELTDAAEKAGSVYLYLGDDQLLYQ